MKATFEIRALRLEEAPAGSVPYYEEVPELVLQSLTPTDIALFLGGHEYRVELEELYAAVRALSTLCEEEV